MKFPLTLLTIADTNGYEGRDPRELDGEASDSIVTSKHQDQGDSKPCSWINRFLI